MAHIGLEEDYTEASRLRRLEFIIFGNGNPGLKGQMALTQQTVERIDNSLKWIVRLLAGTFITTVGGIVMALVIAGHK